MSDILIDRDFTLMTISIREDTDGKQHAVVHDQTKTENPNRIESIPWSELIGRRITMVCMDDGRLVLGLSTKN